MAAAESAGAPLSAPSEPPRQSSLRWEIVGELPDRSGGGVTATNLGVGGAFAGVHDGALIIAGGSNFPIAEGESLWSDKTGRVLYGDIWVATFEAQSSGNPPALSWHATDVRLPSPRAYGASASHASGVVLVGGNDGNAVTSETLLLRWDAVTRQLRSFRLPDLPVPSSEGGAAVIGDSLYLLAGHDGVRETADLYSLDLGPLSAALFDRVAGDGADLLSHVGPWRRLAPIPAPPGQSRARSKMMVAAQSDGEATRLYVMGGQRLVAPGESDEAVPVSCDPEHPRVLFLQDVWAFTPAPGSVGGSWRRMADIMIAGDEGGRAAGTAVAVGQTEILLLASAKGDLIRKVFGELKAGWADYPGHPGFERQALIYDAHGDVWSAAGLAPMVADPLGGTKHPVCAAAVTTQAVQLGGRVILPSGEVRPRVRTPAIWAIDHSSQRRRH